MTKIAVCEDMAREYLRDARAIVRAARRYEAESVRLGAPRSSAADLAGVVARAFGLRRKARRIRAMAREEEALFAAHATRRAGGAS